MEFLVFVALKSTIVSVGETISFFPLKRCLNSLMIETWGKIKCFSERRGCGLLKNVMDVVYKSVFKFCMNSKKGPLVS